MDLAERLEATRACQDLVARYALAVNTRDVDAYVGLYTDDGEWHRPDGHSMIGRGAIREFIDWALPDPAVRTLRHVNGATVIELVDADNATSWSQTTVYDEPVGGGFPVPLSGPDQVVEYRDVMVRRDGRWFFAERHTTVIFSASAVLQPPAHSS